MKKSILSPAGVPFLALIAFGAHPHSGLAAEPESPVATPAPYALPEVVVSDTRSPLDVERAPSAVTVITSEEIEKRQIRSVAEALRSVPGLNVIQTGSPGQLTSVFIRGLTSEATQVMIDGIPINQGLAGLFNFADLTTDNLDRIEVVRGPQSSIYGPRAGGGVINLISKRGTKDFESTATFEGGTFNTYREAASTAGKLGKLDYSAGVSRLDTEGDRQNSEYRASTGIANIGITPFEGLRVFALTTYSLADAGSPNSIFTPRFKDNLLTERWMVAPGIEFQPFSWWKHRLVTDYDEERQVFNPNEDGFVGNTRAAFKRYQLDYQNEITPTHWLKITSGIFYSRVEAKQEQPFILFGPTLLQDKTENEAVFLQLEAQPYKDLLLVASGRYDHFSQFGDIATYRLAGSYKLPKVGTVVRSSLGTGFIPPSSQDKIYGGNPLLDPNETKGFDIGFEQPLWGDRIRFGANYFHNKLSNVIGFDGLFRTLNLGRAETEGVEVFLHFQPLPELTITANYTYLDAEKTSALDIQQPQGARLPRRPRNELFAGINYLWFKKVRTGFEVKYVNAREELVFGSPNIDIEDYTVCRLFAEYDVTPNVKLIGRIENLTEQKYAEVLGYPNPGRAFYGGVSWRF